MVSRPNQVNLSTLPTTASVGYLLAMVGAESRRRFTTALERLQFRPSHYGAMTVLAATGPAAQIELARSLGIDPRNFVLTLDHLEQRGFIKRTNQGGDRRRNTVSLTKAGEAVLEDLRAIGETVEEEFLTPLTHSERAQLRMLLLKLRPDQSATAG